MLEMPSREFVAGTCLAYTSTCHELWVIV